MKEHIRRTNTARFSARLTRRRNTIICAGLGTKVARTEIVDGYDSAHPTTLGSAPVDKTRSKSIAGTNVLSPLKEPAGSTRQWPDISPRIHAAATISCRYSQYTTCSMWNACKTLPCSRLTHSRPTASRVHSPQIHALDTSHAPSEGLTTCTAPTEGSAQREQRVRQHLDRSE